MASHRRPRTPLLQSPASRRGAAGVTTAALASVTLLSQSTALAAPGDDRPSVEEVAQRVDTLYKEAGSATQEYNAAKEKTEKQRAKVDRLLDDAARRTAELNDARRVLGGYAAAQYRTGGVSGTAALLLSSDPQGFFSRQHLMSRLTDRQQQAVADYREELREANRKREEAGDGLAALTDAQKRLRDTKKAVQGKLAEARKLLSELTAEEKAELAAAERERQEEARRAAAAAAAEREEEREREEQTEQPPGTGTGSGTGDGTGTGTESGTDTDPGTGGGTADDAYATKAAKVVAFAEAQLGKPYVWGATGPNSYDCSGLTQAAWLSAGVSLPRVTYDQVNAGTTVPRSEMRPGDLVFSYDDVSHVGIYVGDGQMIHAPKPGEVIRYESIDYMPFHSAVRPA